MKHNTKKCKVSHSRYMETNQIKDLLSEEIEALTMLQMQISDSGDELSPMQKRQIRNIIAGNRLHEMFKEIELFFRQGSTEDVQDSLDYINNIMKQFN